MQGRTVPPTLEGDLGMWVSALTSPATWAGQRPCFRALETLVEPSKQGQESPTGPDAGLQTDAADYDGDRDLDLLVGGYSLWMPKAHTMTAAEQEKVKALQSERQAISRERQKVKPIRAKYLVEITPLTRQIADLDKQIRPDPGAARRGAPRRRRRRPRAYEPSVR